MKLICLWFSPMYLLATKSKLAVLFSRAGWHSDKSQCSLGSHTRRRILRAQDRVVSSWNAKWHAPTRQFWARSGNCWHQCTGWCRSCQYVLKHLLPVCVNTCGTLAFQHLTGSIYNLLMIWPFCLSIYLSLRHSHGLCHNG